MSTTILAIGCIGIGILSGGLIIYSHLSDRILDAEFDKRFFQMEAIKYKCEKEDIRKKYLKLMEKQTGGDQHD